MNNIQTTKKKLSNAVFMIVLLLLNSATVFAEGKILHEKKYSVEMGETLLVEFISADIKVRSWDENEVQLIVKGSNSINDKFEFEFSYEDGVVKAIAEKKSDWSSWSWSNDFSLIVKVPNKFNLNLKTSGGDVEIKNTSGEIVIKTSGGDIELKNSQGSLSAKTSGGDVEVTNFIGDAAIKTSGGDIEVKNIDGAIEAKTSGGDIEINSSNGKVMAGTSGGDIDLKYDGKNFGVDLYTSGGTISVKLPNDFAADVTLKTSGGSINNKFTNSNAREISKSKYVGKYNKGGADFTAKTSGGSIYVK